MVGWLVPKTLDTVRVLIVEDDQDTREMLALALAHHAATVRHVGTGAAAMRVLAELAPHVVLCDLGLPDISGLDWLIKLRAMPDVPAIPAIALSGHSEPRCSVRTVRCSARCAATTPSHALSTSAPVRP
jgi:CheY-like chemotaxis protein